jgi:hypothetical protein
MILGRLHGIREGSHSEHKQQSQQIARASRKSVKGVSFVRHMLPENWNKYRVKGEQRGEFRVREWLESRSAFSCDRIDCPRDGYIHGVHILRRTISHGDQPWTSSSRGRESKQRLFRHEWQAHQARTPHSRRGGERHGRDRPSGRKDNRGHRRCRSRNTRAVQGISQGARELGPSHDCEWRRRVVLGRAPRSEEIYRPR